MATFNWPGFGISAISWSFDQPSQSNASTWTGSRTVVTNPWHGKWSAQVTLATRQGDANFQAIRGFFTGLQGRINNFHLPAVEAPQNANAGVTLSTSAAQGATGLALTGLTTALAAGNMVTIAGQLLSITSVGSLSGSAQTINFMPALRAAAASGASVETAKPYALVYLSESSFSWDIAQWRRYGLSFAVEDDVGAVDGADPALDVWSAGSGGGGGGGGGLGATFTFPQLASFTTRSLLAAVSSPTNKQVAYLTESGREGAFVFSTVNLSSSVSADPQQGLYVAPSSDPTGTSGAWTRKFDGSVRVPWFGAVGDGTTDDYAAVAAALSSGAKLVEFLPGNYRLSAGITVPSGVSLVSEGVAIAGSAGSGGTASFGGACLVFDSAVATCVTLGSADNGTAGLRGITVRRSGTAPAGSVGVLVNAIQMPVLQDVYVHNHAIGYDFKALGTGGISAWLNRVFSAAITDAHWVVDGWPEIRATNCRFGDNGAIDTNCNAYIRIQGGGAGSGSGPNTIILDSCQFNLGNSAVCSTMLEMKNVTQASGVVSEVKMTDCYAENFNTGISTDSTVLSLRRLSFKGCTFNATGVLTSPVHLSLNAATVINEWEMIGNEYFGSDFSVSSRTINGLLMSGNRFACPVSITASASSNSTASLIGNSYLNGGLTVAGSTGWKSLTVSGETMQTGSTLTNSAGPAQNVQINVIGQSIGTWTPVLNFGGATTGITYNIQSATYQLIGNMVLAEFRIQLTSKGSATGSATVSGVPVSYNSGLFQTGGGGVLMASNALSGITGPILAQYGAGSVIKLMQQAATATASLTDANFTNTSEIGGHIVFFI